MKPDPFQEGPLRDAVRDLFNADVESSQRVLKGYVATWPRDPLGYALSAAVPFYHYMGGRLRPHGGGSIQEMILGKGIAPPPNIQEVGTAVQRARRSAEVDLGADPRDQNALLALCIAEGVERDALVLLHKRWMASLKHAQAATLQARRLLEVNARA